MLLTPAPPFPQYHLSSAAAAAAVTAASATTRNILMLPRAISLSASSHVLQCRYHSRHHGHDSHRPYFFTIGSRDFESLKTVLPSNPGADSGLEGAVLHTQASNDGDCLHCRQHAGLRNPEALKQIWVYYSGVCASIEASHRASKRHAANALCKINYSNQHK